MVLIMPILDEKTIQLIFMSFRSVHLTVCGVDGAGWSAVVFPGAGGRAEHQTGQHRRLETHFSKTGWHWLLQLCGE